MFMLKHLFSSQSQSQATLVPAPAIKVEEVVAVVEEREGESHMAEGRGEGEGGEEGGVDGEGEGEGESEREELDLGEKRKRADRDGLRRQQQLQQQQQRGFEVEEEVGGESGVVVPIRDKSLNGQVEGPEHSEEEEQYTGPMRGKNGKFVKTAKGKRGRKSKSIEEEDDAEPKPKVKRGRKAKKSDVVAEAEDDDNLPNGEPEPAKKAGRPRKRQSDVEALSEADYTPLGAKNGETEEEVVVAPERITSRRKSSEKQASEESSISPELVALPAKLEKAKKKARLSSKGKQPALDAEDDNDSAAPLHQPLTPAHYHRVTQSNSWDDVPTSAQPQRVTQPAEEPPPILPPSKKALGKRKASDVAAVSNKKPKPNNKAGGTDLRNFGFTPENDRSRSGSSEGNGNSYVAADAELNEMGKPSAITRLQQQPRRATPKFTPINPRLVPRVEISSSQKSREHIPYPIPPLEDGDVFGFQPQQPEPEPESKSSGRRKRRLPVDEPDQSMSKASRKRDPKPKSPKTPKSPSTRKEKLKPEKKSTPRAKSVKPGRLTTEEYETIYTAVESWRDQHDVSQFEMNEVIQSDPHKNSSAKELFNFVCEEASEIPRPKIINACRRKFHNFERGAFTEEQDEELRTLYEQNPGKWKEIAQAMNRFPEDCRDRWRNYVVCGDKMRKDLWDREEEDRLRNVVAEVLESIRELQPLARNGNSDAESLIDWNIVSQKMDRTRSRLQCLSKWKQLKERMDTDAEDSVAEQPVSDAKWRLDKAEEEAKTLGPKDKLNLLYAIRDWAPGREGKIPWRRIQKEGLGTKMTLRVAFRDMKERVPDFDELKLQALVDWLIDAFEAAAPDEPPGFTEGFPRSSQKNKRFVLKRKRETNEKFLKDENESNGEGPSKPKSTRRKKEAMINEMERNDVASSMPQPVNGKKKRKLRDKMKEQGESVSQETMTADAVVESDNFSGAFEILKNGKGKPKGKGKAKKPIATATTTAKGKKAKKILSEEKVVESEEELQLEEPEPEPEHEVEPASEPESKPESAFELLSSSPSPVAEHEHEAKVDVEHEVEVESKGEPVSESESESESETYQNGNLEEVDDGDKMDLDEDPANEQQDATSGGSTAASSTSSSNSSSASESKSGDESESANNKEPTPKANGLILDQTSEAGEDEESEEERDEDEDSSSEEQDKNEDEDSSSEEQDKNEDEEMISGESFHDTESIDLDAPTQLESDDDEGIEDEKEDAKIKQESWGWATNGYLNGMNDNRDENGNGNENGYETDTSESSDEGSIPAVPRGREESREL